MDKYCSGTKNKIVRLYFYSQRGLALFNEFRYLLMLLFGLYVMLKLDNPLIFVLMFCVSCPLLILFGYIQVHYMSKVIDFLNIEFSTYWTRKSMDWQERTVKAVEDINSKITKG